MADLLFAISGDSQFVKLEGDDVIHDFVERNRRRFPEFETTIEDIYNRVSFLEPDPVVRDRLMARLFLIPDFKSNFKWLGEMSNERFELHIRNFKDHLSYRLFPMASELDKNVENCNGLEFGGALLRSLCNVPRARGIFTYFNNQDSIEPDDSSGCGKIDSEKGTQQ